MSNDSKIPQNKLFALEIPKRKSDAGLLAFTFEGQPHALIFYTAQQCIDQLRQLAWLGEPVIASECTKVKAGKYGSNTTAAAVYLAGSEALLIGSAVHMLRASKEATRLYGYERDDGVSLHITPERDEMACGILGIHVKSQSTIYVYFVHDQLLDAIGHHRGFLHDDHVTQVFEAVGHMPDAASHPLICINGNLASTITRALAHAGTTTDDDT